MAVLSAPLGILVMAATSVVKQPHWSHRIKTVTLVLLSGVAALLQLVTQGKLLWHHWSDLGTDASVMIATSTVLYHTYFEQTKLNTKLTQFRLIK